MAPRLWRAADAIEVSCGQPVSTQCFSVAPAAAQYRRQWGVAQDLRNGPCADGS